MDEMLTTYDEQFVKTGVKSRDAIHRDGDWHETFHCWFIEVNEEGEYIYFQKRSLTKKDFPGKYDISAAGHIEEGEEVLAAGLREIEEELGLVVKASDLIYKGFVKEFLRTQNFLDREICHLYFFILKEKLTFHVTEEVDSLVKVKIEDFISLFEENTEEISAISVAPLYGNEEVLTMVELCPHQSDYFKRVIELTSELDLSENE